MEEPTPLAEEGKMEDAMRIKEEVKEQEDLPVPDSILPDNGIAEGQDAMVTGAATISIRETGEPLMITGEDGVVYRVSYFAGKALVTELLNGINCS